MFEKSRSTFKQQKYILNLLVDWNPEDYQKLFELSGTDNPIVLDDHAPIILRVVALLKAEASTMIHLLKNRSYTDHLMSLTTDGAPDLTDVSRKIRDDFIHDGVFPEDVAENPQYYPDYTTENLIAFHEEYQRRQELNMTVAPDKFNMYTFVRGR